MYFQNYYVSGMIENKFAILDEVRQIETEADFPMSLSIGIAAWEEKIWWLQRITPTQHGSGSGPGGEIRP